MQKKSKELFISRHKGGERAILVYVDLFLSQTHDDFSEFKALAISAGVEILSTLTVKRSKPEAKHFIGIGKVMEIADSVSLHKADVVIFNYDLTPAQERNLEKSIQTRVVDRTGLILDIFAQRARTFEGKLQVELAQLKHLSTRLVRGWTHLERQKGGIGLRGPGETQLETDRRLIGHRIKSINRRLDKVRKQRYQSRKARARRAVPTIALVGYTNAGKSTLFNQLTHEGVYVAHQLFATLDPTLRQIQLAHYGKVIVADTVGFVRDLPHDLIAAFRATLEETREADLLLHVIDAHHAHYDETIISVENVLDEIGAKDLPTLKVYNKIDLRDEGVARIDRDQAGKPIRVWCSALSGDGISSLLQCIPELLADRIVNEIIKLTPKQANLRAKLYGMGVVDSEDIDEHGISHLKITMSDFQFRRLKAKTKLSTH